MADRAAQQKKQKNQLETWLAELLPSSEDANGAESESGSMPLDLEALEASLKSSIDRRAVALRRRNAA
jgi:hypothetical protein